MREFSRADAAKAAQAVASLPEALRAEANESVASSMAQTSPQNAISYLNQLGPNERSSSAYKDVASSWMRSSWPETEAWWRSLPAEDTTARSGALAAISGKLYESDPSGSGQLVGAISAIPDINLRYKAMETLIGAMAKKDPEAARALVAEPGMKLPSYASQALQQRIASSIRNPNR